MKTFKIFISGTVQGVFFRTFLKEKADELNLKGFARNLDDGRVEVIVEGKDENVNKMIQACKQGPPHAQVSKVETEELKHQGLNEFKVLRF